MFNYSSTNKLDPVIEYLDEADIDDELAQFEDNEDDLDDIENDTSDNTSKVGFGLSNNVIFIIIGVIVYLLIKDPNMNINSVLNLIKKNYIIVLAVLLILYIVQ